MKKISLPSVPTSNEVVPRSNNQVKPRSYSHINSNTYSLLQGITKRTSFNYTQAIKRNKEQPFEEQQRRVLRKLRSRLSKDNYSEFLTALNHQPLLKRVIILKNLEVKLGK